MTRIPEKFIKPDLASVGLEDFYDVIVGSQSFATHSTLSAGAAALSSGDRMLVLSDQTLSGDVTISAVNVQIDVPQGVTISGSGSVKLNGIRQSWRGGTFSGLTTAVDLTSNSEDCTLRNLRFSGCTTNINDSGTNNSILGTIDED